VTDSDRHLRLLQTFINYGRKRLYDIGPLAKEVLDFFSDHQMEVFNRFSNYLDVAVKSVQKMSADQVSMLQNFFPSSLSMRPNKLECL
jgi:hypothetical protein